MSKLMDQLKKDISNWPPGYLSRQHIERVKQTIPDSYQCVSCGEALPDSHYLGTHNSENQWEPFCKECFDVTIAIRKWEERNAE